MALSALFLYFDIIAEVILLLTFTAIGLTMWLAQLKPEEVKAEEMSELRSRVESLEKSLREQGD